MLFNVVQFCRRSFFIKKAVNLFHLLLSSNSIILVICLLTSMVWLSACNHKIMLRKANGLNDMTQRPVVFEQERVHGLPSTQYVACGQKAHPCKPISNIHIARKKNSQSNLRKPCLSCLTRSVHYFTKDCFYPATILSSKKPFYHFSDVIKIGAKAHHQTLYFGNDEHALKGGMKTSCRISAKSLGHYARTTRKQFVVLSLMFNTLLTINEKSDRHSFAFNMTHIHHDGTALVIAKGTGYEAV